MPESRRPGARRHLTYANVTSTVALFAAVAGGSALAASKQLGPASPGATWPPLIQAVDNSTVVAPGQSAEVSAPCSYHYRLISGGGRFQRPSGTLYSGRVDYNNPGYGWTVGGANHGRNPQKLTASAMCGYVP